MNKGDGPYSYAQNSSYQRGVVDAAKEMIGEAIADKLDIKHLSFASLNAFCIADFGCSVGPNTFIAVQNILEPVEFKYQTQGLNSRIPEFQVFFNDHVTNDFNTLFTSLTPYKRYFAAGIPGSFYNRLFPKASLHFVHSSNSLHWLSKVPKEVLDINSPAWNKGRIHYVGSAKEVLEAYSAQYAKDMESFLYARAQEVVDGGLMALLIASLPDGILHSQTTTGMLYELLGSCLMDMAKTGVVSEAKVDSFNLPIYYTSTKELEAIIERNGYFNIERMEKMDQPMMQATPNLQMCTLHTRAVMEGLIKEHFGSEIIDELFNRYTEKVAESSFVLNLENRKVIELFVLLKRKMTN
ncbi:hypothetical protein HHK36_006847 [Tetracentron sinense]|uniref:Uncharacterized protein n=1 Tax=Tetracentron sinense TaxID=13715 RepID=A0A834ZJR5_TETSI|nr:hypothetical protein HHK36_006847 [Tetracentron sinense]